eukprot:maker-scaffold40_size501252-snap-gene-0.17 protein:Tk06155 transcript:maker-scaffold40_size501252-snap-gene-0.17-mRNA-1 annotation:"protein ovo"
MCNGALQGILGHWKEDVVVEEQHISIRMARAPGWARGLEEMDGQLVAEWDKSPAEPLIQFVKGISQLGTVGLGKNILEENAEIILEEPEQTHHSGEENKENEANHQPTMGNSPHANLNQENHPENQPEEEAKEKIDSKPKRDRRAKVMKKRANGLSLHRFWKKRALRRCAEDLEGSQRLSPFSLYSRPPPSLCHARWSPIAMGSSGANSSQGQRDGGSQGGDSNNNGNHHNGHGNNNGGHHPFQRDSSGGHFRNMGNGPHGTPTGNEESGQLDLDNFEYPDSPTQKWLADNADLSPLTVLDNINLKSEFPYANHSEIEKPPDINTISLDTATESILQFSASVPVPDSSSTFLDIGTDSFTQSLYDDLGDINLADFQAVTATGTPTIHTLCHGGQMPQMSMPSTPGVPLSNESINAHLLSTSPFSTGMLMAKPVTLEKLQTCTNPQTITSATSSISLANIVRVKEEPRPIDVTTLNLSSLPRVPMAPTNVTNNSNLTHSIPHPSLRNLMEPLPASALKGLIKQEIHVGLPTTPVYHANMVKLEHPEMQGLEHSDHTNDSMNNPVYSPLSLSSCPNSPMGSPCSNGGGKMKGSPQRKKSLSTDEDDISNIPSLKMRIQIISQRIGIPADMPIELINGGHGIKNPLSSDTGIKPEEKLPPVRPQCDPSKFQCRICSKMFSLQRLLNRHMKCHSDTKRYLCTFCGKGFNDTFDLKRHTRTHTGVRPYKCNLCEKSFTQRCSLESHCLKVHGVAHQYDYKQRRSKMYVCEDCGHTTSEPEIHYLHLKENHPYSPALLKFYDKRHFKFSNANFASMLLQVS